MGKVAYYNLIRTPRKGHAIAKVHGISNEKVRDILLRKKIQEFEAGFPDGVYLEPTHRKEPVVKLKAMLDFCAKEGLEPAKLTPEQLEPFLEYPEHDKK